MKSTWLGMALIFFSLNVLAASKAEERMKLLEKLDMLDAMEFESKLDEAYRCIASRFFDCAQKNIADAQKLASTQSQQKQLNRVKQRQSEERNRFYEEKRLAKKAEQARKDREYARKKALKREKERERQRQEELAYERQRQSSSNNNDWVGALATGLSQMQSTLPSIEESQRQVNESIRLMHERQSAYEEKERARKQQERADRAYQAQLRESEIKRQQLYAEQQRRAQIRKDQKRRELARVEREKAEQALVAKRAQERERQRRAAELAKVEPKAQFGSIYRGRMNEVDKVSCDCDGKITKRNFSVGSCKIASMTVSYKISNFVGEPMVNGNFIWQAPGGEPADCLTSDFKLWMKLQNADSHGYVKLSPTVPNAGKWSYNVKGSPNWDSFLCGFNGAEETNCFDSKTAKTLYKAGKVVDFIPSHK